jgi:hypothetical protein
MNKKFIETQTRASLLENTGFNSLYTYGLYLVKQTKLEGYDPLGSEDDLSEYSESYKKLNLLYRTLVRGSFHLLRMNVNDYVWTNYYQHDEQHQSGFENAAEEYVASNLDDEDEECDEAYLDEMFRDLYAEYFEFQEFMHYALLREANAEVILDVLRLLDGDYRLMTKDLQNHDLHDLMIETLYASMLRVVENNGYRLTRYLWEKLFGALLKNTGIEYDDEENSSIIKAFLASIDSNTPMIKSVVELALPILFAKTPKSVRHIATNKLEVEVEA